MDDVYVATRGFSVDGHRFIPGAIKSGATAIVCEEAPSKPIDEITYMVVPDAREALARLANAYFEYLSKSLKLFGVTGTNGKTTTATLMYRIAKSLGRKSGLLSTIANYVDGRVIPSTHTTGDAVQICSIMSEMVREGCTHCFMEVTSHAVHQHRTTGLEFDVAILTNLTQDHLDYHGTMEAYADVKKAFFDNLGSETRAVLNSDDKAYELMSRDTKAKVETYGQEGNPDYRIGLLQTTESGISFELGGHHVSSQMHGAFNAYNLTASITALCGDAELAEIIRHTSELQPVAGRLQRVDSVNGIVGIVDFAHTPDAVENVLKTLKNSLPDGGRLITVLGCGGDRDRDKRPKMAGLAVDLSDFVVLTSDNPRSEDPGAIIDDMIKGIRATRKGTWTAKVDRRAAIAEAVGKARSGDFVLVAGKGHEKYQEISGTKHPFDDVVELQTAFQNRML